MTFKRVPRDLFLSEKSLNEIDISLNNPIRKVQPDLEKENLIRYYQKNENQLRRIPHQS